MHPFRRITFKCLPALWATYCLWHMHLAHFNRMHQASGVACKLPVNIALALTKPTSDRGVGQDGRTKCAHRAARFHHVSPLCKLGTSEGSIWW